MKHKVYGTESRNKRANQVELSEPFLFYPSKYWQELRSLYFNLSTFLSAGAALINAVIIVQCCERASGPIMSI